MVISHLGFGDHVIFNGLVRALVDIHGQVFVPCKTHNLPSVDAMYADDHRIKVLEVSGDEEARVLAKSFRGNTLNLGIFSGHPDACKPGWDKLQYEQAGVPFDNRWSKFSIPDGWLSKYESCESHPSFYHNDMDRGYVMSRDKLGVGDVVFPKRSDKPIWHWLGVMQIAPEIHVIDSCWLSIAESVPTKGKLFFHRYARPGGVPPTLRKNWTIID